MRNEVGRFFDFGGSWEFDATNQKLVYAPLKRSPYAHELGRIGFRHNLVIEIDENGVRMQPKKVEDRHETIVRAVDQQFDVRSSILAVPSHWKLSCQSWKVMPCSCLCPSWRCVLATGLRALRSR